MIKYPVEVLDEDEDDGTMVSNVRTLAENVVGHRIVEAKLIKFQPYKWSDFLDEALAITLDNGKSVIIKDTSDCCAGTELSSFLLYPDKVDHIITGVGTTDGYTTWHIYADYGDVLSLKLSWSAGNPFYYGYGFDITVEELPTEKELV